MKTRSGIQVVDSLASIPASDWDALAGNHPLLSHAFLHALHESGCASAETGWAPCHLTLWRGKPLAAGLAPYLQCPFHGRYLIVSCWAGGHQRHQPRQFAPLIE